MGPNFAEACKTLIEACKENPRYEIQNFYFLDGRTWHVYDRIEKYHIHTASRGQLKEDNSCPDSCIKICEALNAYEYNSRG